MISYKFIESTIKGNYKKTSFSMFSKLMPYSSLNNLPVFNTAYNQIKLINLITKNKKVYDVSYNKFIDIDVFVIVIGESVRSDHLSLYGYGRNTTPNLDKIQNDMFVFSNAIAPSPTTQMSLSTVLSNKSSISNDYSTLNDNIINLANSIGFDTYWFTKQGEISQHDSAVTAIAKGSHKSKWINNGFDDALLADLKLSLENKSNKKKLIVLHTNGSHPIACGQYPQNFNYFSGGSPEEDCYDNSILFMDSFINDVINLISDKKSSLMYFSDHGQLRRIKQNHIQYIHGAINPSKGSVDVPFFIWYSKLVEDKKIGKYKHPYPTADNYELIANWIGIDKVNGVNITSPLKSDFKYSKKDILIMDTELNILNYKDLKSDID